MASSNSKGRKVVRGPRPNISAKAHLALLERIGQQRGAIFQAQAIVQTVVKAMDPASWSSKPGYPYALELVDEMLERIAAELDGGVSEMDDSAGVQS